MENESNDTPTTNTPVRIKTVSVTHDRKVNLGNYESANIGVTVWADVAEDADLNQVMHDLWAMAQENVKVQVAQYDKRGASVEVNEAFLGLPVNTEDDPPLPF